MDWFLYDRDLRHEGFTTFQFLHKRETNNWAFSKLHISESDLTHSSVWL